METYLIKSQRLSVRLQCLIVVPVRLLDKTKDMPANVRHEIEFDALFDEIDAFLASPHVCKHETLHT